MTTATHVFRCDKVSRYLAERSKSQHPSNMGHLNTGCPSPKLVTLSKRLWRGTLLSGEFYGVHGSMVACMVWTLYPPPCLTAIRCFFPSLRSQSPAFNLQRWIQEPLIANHCEHLHICSTACLTEPLASVCFVSGRPQFIKGTQSTMASPRQVRKPSKFEEASHLRQPPQSVSIF